MAIKHSALCKQQFTVAATQKFGLCYHI